MSSIVKVVHNPKDAFKMALFGVHIIKGDNPQFKYTNSFTGPSVAESS